MRSLRPLLLPIFLLWLVPALAGTSFAGPPFLTDDPEPVEFKHWEAYLFSIVDAMRKQTDLMGPALEFNVGALPNLQLHNNHTHGLCLSRRRPQRLWIGGY
jgi:hypothetical protein